MTVISSGGSRAETVNLVLARIVVIETRLAKIIPPELLATRGPRYESMKHGLVDVQRAFHASQMTIKNDREDPEAVVSCLVTLAAAALKVAMDTAAASKTGRVQLEALDDFED